MGTRIRGAVLAFAAAALFAAAVSMAWWSGNPVQDGKVIESKTVSVGLLSFEGCRGVGGAEEQCKSWRHSDPGSSLHAGTEFVAAGFATLGTCLLAVLLLVCEGAAALAGAVSARRKLAIAALIASALAGAAGAVFVLTAPAMHGAPRAIAPFLAFGAAGLGVVQALIAMRPDRVREPRAPRVREPKPEKAPKAAKPPKAKAVKAPKVPKTKQPSMPIHVPPAGPPPGGYAPIDFLALMEEDARPRAPARPTPSSHLPGAAGVLGTSMPSPSSPGYGGGNGGMPVSGPNAQTMYPQMHQAMPPQPPMPPVDPFGQTMGPQSMMPPPPQHQQPPQYPPPPPPLAQAWTPQPPPPQFPPQHQGYPPNQYPPPPPPNGPPPSAQSIAPTQAIHASPGGVAPGDMPSGPMVMPIAPGHTPPPEGWGASTEPDGVPQTAIPVPPLFATSGSSAPETVRGTAPPPFRPGKSIPPALRTKQPTQQPGFASPIPAAARIALDTMDADPRAHLQPVGDHTAPSTAAPDGAEPTDTGPIADPPPPDDLDGRYDTASDLNETVERSVPEREVPGRGVPAPATDAGPRSPFMTPLPFAAVDPDETVPREKSSTTEILTSAPKTPPPVKTTPPPVKTTPPPVKTTPPPVATTPPPQSPSSTRQSGASGAIPMTTASPDLPPPSAGQEAVDGPAPACPQCDSPMNWVEKHLRFYCGSCRMYF